jgi:phage major head subunit gpT-like protein
MITPANFATFVTNANTLIGHVYDTDNVDSVYKTISSEVPCTSTQWTTAWTGLMPKMRLWDGPRQPHQPGAQTYTIIPQPWENTYSIDRFVLDDDQFGVYYRMLGDLARQSKRHPDIQFRDLLEATGVQGATALQKGPDGVAFFSTAHPIDFYNAASGTYINDFASGGQTVSGITVGGALSPTAFTSIYEYMTTLVGEDLERLGVIPNIMMVPPTLKAEGELILKSTFFAPPAWGAFSSIGSQVGAADNPLKRFGVDLLVNSWLKSNKNYYLLDTTMGMKPLTMVTREPVITVPRVNESDPVVFDTHMFQWGQWARMGFGWGFSFLMARGGAS